MAVVADAFCFAAAFGLAAAFDLIANLPTLGGMAAIQSCGVLAMLQLA